MGLVAKTITGILTLELKLIRNSVTTEMPFLSPLEEATKFQLIRRPKLKLNAHAGIVRTAATVILVLLDLTHTPLMVAIAPKVINVVRNLTLATRLPTMAESPAITTSAISAIKPNQSVNTNSR